MREPSPNGELRKLLDLMTIEQIADYVNDNPLEVDRVRRYLAANKAKAEKYSRYLQEKFSKRRF